MEMLVCIEATDISNGDTMNTFEIGLADNGMDEPDRSFDATLRSTGVAGVFTLGTRTVTLIATDNDPTSVTLAGTAGDINEGQNREFTITLGRALVAGEILPVPLSFTGTATRGSDYNLSGASATGIAYNDLDGATTPTVTFTGPSARVATLNLSITAGDGDTS